MVTDKLILDVIRYQIIPLIRNIWNIERFRDCSDIYASEYALLKFKRII